jgi:5,10-methylenetetrahydrofolate reductase
MFRLFLGIKPIATKTHLQMLPQVFKIDLPESLINEVLKCKTNNDVREVGIEWAINQARNFRFWNSCSAFLFDGKK